MPIFQISCTRCARAKTDPMGVVVRSASGTRFGHGETFGPGPLYDQKRTSTPLRQTIDQAHQGPMTAPEPPSRSDPGAAVLACKGIHACGADPPLHAARVVTGRVA